MRYILRLAVILCLVLTSTGLGLARGTVRIDGQVVICTGEGIVIRAVPGAPGQGKAHYCPDMALSMLDVASLPDMVVMPARTAVQAAVVADVITGVSRPVPAATARGPPPTLVIA